MAILGNPKTAVYFDYLLGAAQAVAPTLGIEATPSHIENDAADIERAIAAIAGVPSMVVLPDSTTTINHDLIISLAARDRLPAVYCFKFIVQAGGPTGLSVLIIIGRQRSTSIEFSAVLSRPSCRYRLRRSMRPPSISKRLKSLV